MGQHETLARWVPSVDRYERRTYQVMKAVREGRAKLTTSTKPELRKEERLRSIVSDWGDQTRFPSNFDYLDAVTSVYAAHEFRH